MKTGKSQAAKEIDRQCGFWDEMQETVEEELEKVKINEHR